MRGGFVIDRPVPVRPAAGWPLVVACLAIVVAIPVLHAAACNATLCAYPDTILFYAGLRFLAAITLAAVVAGWLIVSGWWQVSSTLSVPWVAAAGAVSSALTLAFFVLVPVTIDRSISTFLLSQLESASSTGGMTVADLVSAFEREYLGRHAAIRRRVAEQMAGGTIASAGADAYVLSAAGRRLLRWARLVAAAYGVRDTYVSAADVPSMEGVGAVVDRPTPPEHGSHGE